MPYSLGDKKDGRKDRCDESDAMRFPQYDDNYKTFCSYFDLENIL